MVWGWVIVSLFTFIVALGMAEIVSAIPTSGGPYFWAAILAPPKHSAFASWITGWLVQQKSGFQEIRTDLCIGSTSLVKLQ